MTFKSVILSKAAILSSRDRVKD